MQPLTRVFRTITWSLAFRGAVATTNSPADGTAADYAQADIHICIATGQPEFDDDPRGLGIESAVVGRGHAGSKRDCDREFAVQEAVSIRPNTSTK